MERTQKEQLLQDLWYKRNPCHDNDQEGNDRFWGTVLCVFSDYQKALNTPLVMPRFIVDERSGCIAIRDTHNPEFNNSEGLNQDMPDVVDFEMGTKINTGRFISWDLDPEIIKQFINKCNQLNVA